MRHVILAIVILTCVSGCVSPGVKVELVREGAARATIVLADGDDAVLKRAAGDLQHYVEAISGVRLPIRKDGRRVDGVGLYIGRCAPSLETDPPPADVTPEAFAIRVRDGNVLFAGRCAHAVEFAVYTFIEDRLGVRWFWPGPLGEVLPPRSPGELTVTVVDEVVVPDWSPRVWSGNHYYPSWRDWNRRNKLSQGPPLPRREFQNRMHAMVPPDKYAKTHPEYFPLVNGKRWIPPKGLRHWRPCESNPEVQQLIVDYAVKHFEQHPDSDGVSLGMDDIVHMCGCAACCAMDASPGDHTRHRFSDRHYKFVNLMARKIAERCPGKHVGTLIYHIAHEPPKTVDRLEPNVFGYLTQSAPEWFRPGRKRRDVALTREWAKRCSQLYRYDYWGLGFLTPRYCPHNVADAMKIDKSLGLRGIYIEVYTCWPNTAPMIWAGSKLFWKTGLDIDALLDEFVNEMYGSAAPVMKRYYDRLERSWNTPRPGRAGWGHANVLVNARSMSVEDVAACERLLVEARKGADTDVVRQRIDVVAAGLRFGGYLTRIATLADEITDATVTDRASANATLDRIAEINRLDAERIETWAAIRARKDLAGETFNALAKYSGGRKFGQANGLSAAAASALPRVLHWIGQHDPGHLDAVAARLKGLRGPLGEISGTWLSVQKGGAKNLLVNGDFEAKGQNAAKPEQDWSTAQAPPGWSTWTRSSCPRQFAVKPGEGVDTSNAAGITNAANACYLQNLKVKPGERYLCCVSVRRTPADGEGDVSLTVRWRRPNGQWLELRTHESAVKLSATSKQYEPLMLLATAPKGAGELNLQLGAQAQADNVTAWFDNAAVYRVRD